MVVTSIVVAVVVVGVVVLALVRSPSRRNPSTPFDGEVDPRQAGDIQADRALRMRGPDGPNSSGFGV